MAKTLTELVAEFSDLLFTQDENPRQEPQEYIRDNMPKFLRQSNNEAFYEFLKKFLSYYRDYNQRYVWMLATQWCVLSAKGGFLDNIGRWLGLSRPPLPVKRTTEPIIIYPNESIFDNEAEKKEFGELHNFTDYYGNEDGVQNTYYPSTDFIGDTLVADSEYRIYIQGMLMLKCGITFPIIMEVYARVLTLPFFIYSRTASSLVIHAHFNEDASRMTIIRDINTKLRTTGFDIDLVQSSELNAEWAEKIYGKGCWNQDNPYLDYGDDDDDDTSTNDTEDDSVKAEEMTPQIAQPLILNMATATKGNFVDYKYITSGIGLCTLEDDDASQIVKFTISKVTCNGYAIATDADSAFESGKNTFIIAKNPVKSTYYASSEASELVFSFDSIKTNIFKLARKIANGTNTNITSYSTSLSNISNISEISGEYFLRNYVSDMDGEGFVNVVQLTATTAITLYLDDVEIVEGYTSDDDIEDEVESGDSSTGGDTQEPETPDTDEGDDSSESVDIGTITNPNIELTDDLKAQIAEIQANTNLSDEEKSAQIKELIENASKGSDNEDSEGEDISNSSTEAGSVSNVNVVLTEAQKAQIQEIIASDLTDDEKLSQIQAIIAEAKENNTTAGSVSNPSVEITEELQSQIDAIINDSSLTDEQKLEKLKELIQTTQEGS